MIYFQTKPDKVFEAILQEALISESVEIKILVVKFANCTGSYYTGVYAHQRIQLGGIII